jgi:hypothetical protein
MQHRKMDYLPIIGEKELAHQAGKPQSGENCRRLQPGFRVPQARALRYSVGKGLGKSPA